jgi:hypothetical protein
MRVQALLVAALIALWPATAIAQSAVLQAGPFTAGHLPMYVPGSSYQTVVQDAGTANGGAPNVNPKELGLTVRGNGQPPYANAGVGPLNTNLCDFDAPTTNSTGYHYLCMSPNAQGGGLVAYGHSATASALPFTFSINGSSYEFPFSVGGIVGPTTTVIGDLVAWANTTGTLVSDIASITLAQMPSIPDQTVLCNTSGSTAKPSACTSLPQSMVSFSNESANTVFAGPVSGSSAAPAFRALLGADLPTPQPTSLGGIESHASVAHQFLTQISTTGAVSAAQPAFSDLSGVTNAITNSDLAQAGAFSFKGNNTNATANVTDMSAAQAAAVLPVFTGDSGSGGIQGLVPAPSSGQGSAGYVLGAAGSWTKGGIGVNQTWQTPSRSTGTVYQNTTGAPIEVKAILSMASNQNGQFFVGATSSATLEIDNVAAGGGAATVASVGGIVPNNWYYRVTISGATMESWAELR